MHGLPDAERLLAATDATWAAAERVAVGDWIVRRGAGAGQRVSSVWPKGDPGMPLDAAIAQCGAIQKAWGEAPLFQIGPDAGALDALLAARGWAEHDRSALMVAPVTALMGQGRDDLMAVQVGTPLAVLDELWQAGGINAARRAVIARTPGPKISLMLREDDRPAAAAFVAVDGTLAMIHALVVAPHARRRGLGRAATAAAARWAGRQGAAHLGLAVAAHNDTAMALYRAMDFTHQGVYHYRKGS